MIRSDQQRGAREVMKLPEYWMFESIKLAAQLIGALVVSWLAVRWALSRYKSEKSWERRLSAYSDIVAALGEMRAVLWEWMLEAAGAFTLSVEGRQRLSNRYAEARAKLDEGRSVAELLLPDVTSEALIKLKNDLSNIDKRADRYNSYSEEYDALTEALGVILAQGRNVLGSSS